MSEATNEPEVVEGVPCPTCGNVLPRFPEENDFQKLARESWDNLNKLIHALKIEDLASFAYAFKLGGRRNAAGDYWPESIDEDYWGINRLATKIEQAMAKIAEASRDVTNAIAWDNQGNYGAKTLRFMWELDEADVLKALHPKAT